MAAITAAVLGAASLGYGIYSRMEANSQQEEALQQQQQGSLVQAEAARQRYGINVEQAQSSKEFAGREFQQNRDASQSSLDYALQTQAISRNVFGYEQQAEALRMQMTKLDARRKQTEIIRNQQRARSLGLVNATAQGASRGSGLQGGYGQISGQTGVNLLGVQQNLDAGLQIYGFNRSISQQKLAGFDLENIYALQRASQQTAKAQLSYDYALSNADYQTRLSGTDTLMSQGQGTISAASGRMQSANNQAQMGGQFIQAGLALPGIGTTLQNNYNSLFPTQPTNVGSATQWSNGYTPYGQGGIGRA